MTAAPAADAPPFDPLAHPILLQEPERLSDFSVWRGHIPFALLLIDRARPRTLVELGTHYGDSYCAFCQSVKALETGTRCWAVDTWAGDEHAGFYEDAVYDDLRAHHDPRYASFSTLVRSLFDDAVGQFEDGSIDILHIDGLHTYEAVRHDFETWLPKVSRRGIVLFHDTAVHTDDFGVHRFWDELKDTYPSFAFTHAGGLGVLAVGPEVPAGMRFLFGADAERRDLLRRLFQYLGERWALTGDLPRQERLLEQERGAAREMAAEVERIAADRDAINAHRAVVEADQQRLYAENAALHAEATRLRDAERQLQKIQGSRIYRFAQRMARLIGRGRNPQP
jgi:hypothetical protein